MINSLVTEKVYYKAKHPDKKCIPTIFSKPYFNVKKLDAFLLKTGKVH